MNALVQRQLDRVDTALNTLIDSITSYNPSVPAAIDLLAADDELNKGVEQCKLPLPPQKVDTDPLTVATHQANHARILRLRETTDTINQYITSTLTLLADTRKELLATPATVFLENQRNVPYNELLDYAKRISRYTVPPTFRPPLPVVDAPIAQPAIPPIVNGISESSEQNSTVAPTDSQGKSQGIGVSSLEQTEVEWLDPLTQIPFMPWPSEEVIKRGALAQIQVMLEQGVDPASVGTTNEEREKPEMEIEDVKNQSGDNGEKLGGQGNGGRGPEGGTRGVERNEEKPKVFAGLDLYDPEEEG